MIKHLCLALFLACGLLACGSADPTPSQTPAESASPAPASASPVPQDSQTPRPLPPTWTPQASPTVAAASFNEGAASHTPVFTPSNTPDIGAICYILEPDHALNQSHKTIQAGQSAQIFWKPLPLPGYEYEVRLYHQDGTLLLEELTPDSTFTFPENLLISFEATYGWEVTPYFNFQPTCFPITGEIFVARR